jgi:beta-glucosidase
VDRRSYLVPEGKGKVNQKGLDFYKRMLEELHKNNIMPNATLYHWDLPDALEKQGGWLNRDIAKWFGDYGA